MIALTVSEISTILGGRVEGVGGDLLVTGVATDTRRVKSGDLFFALDGARFRGADFLAEAFRAGAVAAVSTSLRPVPGPIIEVADAERSLLDLGRELRARSKAVVIGITGSNGKTTTKDALAATLGRRFEVVAAEGSYNNRVGLPLTIARADARTEVLVLEVGTSMPGEIGRLADVARPDHLIFTSIGASHLGGLGSIAGVLTEKLDLLGGLVPGGLVVVNGDDPLLGGERTAAAVAAADGRLLRVGLGEGNDLRALDPRCEGGGIAFRLERGGPEFRAALAGEHNLTNVLAVAAIARELGMTAAEIVAGLERVKPSRWRLEESVRDGVHWILDCYNANPSSLAAALRYLEGRAHRGRKIVVLGDMLELGDESRARHETVGLEVARLRPDLAVFVGREMRAAAAVASAAGVDCREVEDALSARAELSLELGAGDLVLVKGSRGLALERVMGEDS